MKLDKKKQLSIAYGILTVLLLLSLSNYFENQVDNVPYSQFRSWVQEGLVTECNIGTETISGKVLAGGVERGFYTQRVDDPELVSLLDEYGVRYKGRDENTWLTTLLGWILPAVVFVGIWMVMARRMGGGSGGLMSIGKSKYSATHELVLESTPKSSA